MAGENRAGRRAYRAPQREAAATRTREAVVRAGRALFVERGWAGTTLRAVAEEAGVSLKTVEAVFKTKATLLQATVEFAIRGDVEPVPMPQREMIARIEHAGTAAAMLDLHAAHLRKVNERSAQVAWVVEQAAPGEPAVQELWSQMNHNRAYAVAWATKILLGKPGRRRGLRRRDVEAAFWVALDWGTYRTLTQYASLTPADYERWLRNYYRLAFLPN